MATSLKAQLEKLKAPQTQLLLTTNKVPSILFDKKEAANITIDAAFELGLSGLKELKKIDSRFAEFDDFLFNESSKSFQRAVQNSTVNKRVSESIKKFLVYLSPHMLIKPALLTLEWLVKRFNIGEYNAEELIFSALPYHGTRTFIFILRAIPEIVNPSSPWHWLYPVLDSGVPLDSKSVQNIVSKNVSLLRRICDYAASAYRMEPRNSGKLQNVFIFTCSTILGVLSKDKGCSQGNLTCIRPYLTTGLSSISSCYASSCIAILSFVFTKVPLSHGIAHELIIQLLSIKVTQLRGDCANALFLLYTAQIRFGNNLSVPKEILTEVSDLTWLPALVANLPIEKNGKTMDVLPFLLPMCEMLLNEIENISDVKCKVAANLMSLFVFEIQLKPSQQSTFLNFIFKKIPTNKSETELIMWYRDLCNKLETKYPESFDVEVCKILKENAETAKRLKKILGVQTVAVDESDLVMTPKGLALRLLHPEPSMRVATIKCLGHAYPTLSEDDRIWVGDALQARLCDDSMDVLLAVLELPSLPQITRKSKEYLIETLIGLLENTPNNKWESSALEKSISLLCNSISDNEDDLQLFVILFTILPPLMLNPGLLPIILKTNFATRCEAIKVIAKKAKNKCDGPSILWGAFEALGSCPVETIDMIQWRLQKSGFMNTIELVLFCRMLCGISKGLQFDGLAKLLDLVNIIKSKAKNIVSSKHDGYDKVNLSKEVYETVIEKDALPVESLIAVLKSIAARPLTTVTSKMSWREDQSELDFCVKLISCLIEGCCNMTDNHGYKEALALMFKTNFPSLQDQINILHLIWGLEGVNSNDIIRCLLFATALIKNRTEEMKILNLDPQASFIPSLLVLLRQETKQVREAVLNLLKEVAVLKEPEPNYQTFIMSILARDKEILQDHNQLIVVMYSLLSPDPEIQVLFVTSHKKYMEKIGECLIKYCCLESTSPHVIASILDSLSCVKSEVMLNNLASFGCKLINNEWPNNQLNAHYWKILTLILDRFQDECAALSLTDPRTWILLQSAFCSPLSHSDGYISGFILKSISKEMFNKLDENLQNKIITLVLEIPENLGQLHEVISMLRRVSLTGVQVNNQLIQLMLKNTQKRRTLPVTATDNWKKGLTLLEAMQLKNKFTLQKDLITTLFAVLKLCIDGSENEYAKQLILGCLASCLHSKEDVKNIDIELLLQCLRGSNNPHTQHQILLLLANSASIIPDNLLHHLVSVFTFMGSLVMRHDDSYSFQVIAQVIDKLVPVITQNEKTGDVSVLRVFVDALPDIPSHRRAPIFKHLMTVLGWNRLWLFFALVSDVDDKTCSKSKKVTCALELRNHCPLSELLLACSFDIKYLCVLATIKFNDQKQVANVLDTKQKLREVGAECLYDMKGLQETKRLQAGFLSLLNDLLNSAEEEDEINEELYTSLLEELMIYLGILSKQEKEGKFWPAMLNHAYSLLDNVVLLMPARQFLSVLRRVLEEGQDEMVRIKTLEVLSVRLQLKTMDQDEQAELLALVPGLKVLAIQGTKSSEKAMYCLRILTHQLARTHTHIFAPVLTSLVSLLCDPNTSQTLQAVAYLCVAELCDCLKASAVPALPRLVPLVLDATVKNRKDDSEANELVLMGAVVALQHIVENLHNFLSPYLTKILTEISLLSSALPENLSSKAIATLQPALSATRSGISHIAIRVLLPAVSSVMTEFRNNLKNIKSIGSLLDILSSSFSGLERAQLEAHITELTSFFITALELRSDLQQTQEESVVSETEEIVISALLSLVLKLPESLFRPLYFQLCNWASQGESRYITFYRCSTKLANSLKGLFVSFAFYFLKQAADLLKKCHSNNEENQYNCLLLESLLETLLAVCTHDKQKFVNKDCFECLMQPLVDQLENLMGGEEALKSRSCRLIGPCLAQFARATADDVLWKHLHYQILLKTRHNNAVVRLAAVGAIKCLAQSLGEELLPLLPEAVPFMAELLEDENPEVEAACQDAVRDLEKILGEPLSKYF